MTLADGRGQIARGKLAAEEHGIAVVEVLARDRVGRAPPSVSVALAPPKGDRLAWAVQKLSELGVDAMWLLASERGVRRVEGERARKARDRLHSIAREAAMQSRQPFVMEVAGVLSVSGAAGAKGHVVMLHQGAATRLSAVLPEDPAELLVLVGPEGGFSPSEVAAGEEAGAAPASLGPPVLRSETAAVVTAALVLARYGRLG